MTSAFGGQRSIQLSYGCLQDRNPENEPASEPASHGFLAEAEAGFNGQVEVVRIPTVPTKRGLLNGSLADVLNCTLDRNELTS